MALNVKLLRQVKKHILEEPKRFYMGHWGIEAERFEERADDPPACGTVGCIAGWTVGLLTSPEALIVTPQDKIQKLATELLGLTRKQANRLFFSYKWPKKFKDAYEANGSDETWVRDDLAKDARIAAARIEHLIKTGE